MSPARFTLAVDLGRTGCRASLWRGDESEPVATGAGAGTVGLTAAAGAAAAENAILAVARPLLAERPLHRAGSVGIGAPGVFVAPEATRELAKRLLKSLPARSVAVTSDAVTSHAGALAGAPGVVLAAGTGAVTIAIGAEQQFHRVDGWGPWFGDEGSGAWLGLAGLRAAARAHDGRGPETALREAAWDQFGSPERLALLLSIDDNPARIAAAFVPAIAAAAEREDVVALGLLHAAGAALGESALAGVAALADGPAPVSVAILGGLAKLGAVLLDPLHAALARSTVPWRLCPAAGTSLDGARRLADWSDGIHEPWVVRTGVPAAAAPRDPTRREVARR